jgi:hypothetical protein
MAMSIYARRRRITIVGLLVLVGIVALVMFFVFGQTKTPVVTPMVTTITQRREEEEEEEEEEAPSAPSCQRDKSFDSQTGSFKCSSIDDFKPEKATWWGSWINYSVPVSSDDVTPNGGRSHTFHALSSSPTEKKYIAMRKTDKHCKMIQFDITKNGDTCMYSINDAGYAGYGGGGMGADEACTATTDAEVIAKWNTKSTVEVARTAETDAGYGLKSLGYSLYCQKELPRGRYVKLLHTVAYDDSAEGNVDDKNRIINLAELEVFSTGGANLAANKPVTGSSEYPTPHLWKNLTDGNKANFAHTYGRTPSEYDSMTVDLGLEQEIEKIVITNRSSCCKNRAVGVKAFILAADGTTIVKETPIIPDVSDIYTLTFPENTWKSQKQYKYEFIKNVETAHTNQYNLHITDIRVDGKRVTSDQIQLHEEPEWAKCNSKGSGYECVGTNYGLNDPEPANPTYSDLTWSAWKEGQIEVGSKVMTITTLSKVKEFEIDYFRPKYVPGWIIKENGKEVFKETTNGGSDETPNPKTVKYVIGT